MVPNPYDIAKKEFADRQSTYGTYEGSLKSGKTQLDTKSQASDVDIRQEGFSFGNFNFDSDEAKAKETEKEKELVTA